MVYRGKVQNGQIVLESGARLAEGLEVNFEPLPSTEASTRPPRGSYEAILPFMGIWADQAEDMDRSLAELRKMKEEEVRRQLERPDAQL